MHLRYSLKHCLTQLGPPLLLAMTFDSDFLKKLTNTGDSSIPVLVFFSAMAVVKDKASKSENKIDFIDISSLKIKLEPPFKNQHPFSAKTIFDMDYFKVL